MNAARPERRSAIRRISLLVAATAATVAALAVTAPAGAAAAPNPARPQSEQPAPHLFPTASAAARAAVVGATSNRLIYHGGPVMAVGTKTANQTVTVRTVLWAPSALQDGTATAFPARYAKLFDAMFTNATRQSLAKNNTQYYAVGRSGTKLSIHPNIKFGGVLVDRTPYGSGHCVHADTGGNCVTDAFMTDLLMHDIARMGWPTNTNSLYFILTEPGEGTCVDSACNDASYGSYCAYHGSRLTSTGAPVIYAHVPFPLRPDGSTDCSAGVSPEHAPAADDAVNMASHEMNEAITDPELNAWYGDNTGAEIADKCAWQFGPARYDGGLADESWNGAFYYVQMEWSNQAKGCVT